jgi:hypothetical protein
MKHTEIPPSHILPANVCVDRFISGIWIILFPYVVYKLSIQVQRFKKNVNKGNHVCRQRLLSPASSFSCIQHSICSPKVYIDRCFSILIGRRLFHTALCGFLRRLTMILGAVSAYSIHLVVTSLSVFISRL